MKTQVTDKNGILIIRAENDHIAFEITPQLGGRIISVYNKDLKKEFLWHNENLNLAENKAGADYDSNFWGGIDELIPNDIPETVDGVVYPDHGELWTASLEFEVNEDHISVFGLLPLSGLYYRKTLSFASDEPVIRTRYEIRNDSGATRNFLWKLHAAVQIAEGDKLRSSAVKARAVDQNASRIKSEEEFFWPNIQSNDASRVPAYDQTMDFFYLYDVKQPEMGMISNEGKDLFEYRYDSKVFPYEWYFASYGQFNNHYTAILEPASAMPVSVNEAKELGQCTVLEAGEEISTLVTIYAGPNKSLPFTDIQ